MNVGIKNEPHNMRNFTTCMNEVDLEDDDEFIEEEVQI